MKWDMTKVVEEIAMQAKENQEEFIFKTIRPYCENVLQMKINKEELKQILLRGARQKGKWIEYEVDIAHHPLHCSICGFSDHHISNRYIREFRRCPNCGAEMEVNNADSD